MFCNEFQTENSLHIARCQLTVMEFKLPWETVLISAMNKHLSTNLSKNCTPSLIARKILTSQTRNAETRKLGEEAYLKQEKKIKLYIARRVRMIIVKD